MKEAVEIRESMMSAIITAEELNKTLKQSRVRVLDASYGQPTHPQGIPGAQDFDIDDIADHEAALPHTIPPPEMFSEKTGDLGIGNNDLVIVYDRNGLSMAASRAWWMFRLFGHEDVKILNGGLPAWIKAGGAIEEKNSRPHPSSAFKAVFKPLLLKQLVQIRENITASHFTVLDARNAERFQAGHIPGSINMPFMNLTNPDGTLKTNDQLKKHFETAGISLQSKLACSCGSGVTACVVALALYELGRPDVSVYDGSWSEWNSHPELPKAKGS